MDADVDVDVDIDVDVDVDGVTRFVTCRSVGIVSRQHTCG